IPRPRHQHGYTRLRSRARPRARFRGLPRARPRDGRRRGPATRRRRRPSLGGLMDPAAASVFSLWTATVLYAIAMVAYSVRLGRIADAKVAAKRELAEVGAAPAAAAPATSVATPPDAPAGPSVVARKALGIGRAATLV